MLVKRVYMISEPINK